MEWNVYKVNDNIDLSNSFFDMLDGSEANHLNYLTLRPIRFYEILKELNSKDILRSDFKITPISISYFNPLKRRKDEIISDKEGILYVGEDLDSPLVYILYRMGKLYFEELKI